MMACPVEEGVNGESSLDDGGEDVSQVPEEALLRKHKAEQRALQDEILTKKKNINKTDKKKKKDLNVWIATQEAQMSERHEAELKELKKLGCNSRDVAVAVAGLENGIATLEMQPRRVSKAEKRRDKKAQEIKQREERIAEGEAENADNCRSVELQNMTELLRSQGLKPVSVPSDGDCMFRALSHQLSLTGERATVTALRKLAADTLRMFEEEYAPFVAADGAPDGDFEDYCVKMENTPAWGGHVELQALSKALKRRIEVIQGSGPSLSFDDADDGKPPLIIAYYRHALGLGEHYDSTEPTS